LDAAHEHDIDLEGACFCSFGLLVNISNATDAYSANSRPEIAAYNLARSSNWLRDKY
jgi:hypothetical protein